MRNPGWTMRRFVKELKERFARCGLEPHPDKTRLPEFGKNVHGDRREEGERRPETFDFPGFTHYCRKDRKGRFAPGRKPVSRRMRRTLKAQESGCAGERTGTRRRRGDGRDG